MDEMHEQLKYGVMKPDGVPGGPPGSPDNDQRAGDEQEARNRAEYENSKTRFRRPDFVEYAERMRPQDIRHDATNLRDFWTNRWYLLGEQPYSYDYILSTRAGDSRVKQLRDSMPNGNYERTQEDVEAGLIEGVFWKPLPSDIFLNTPDLRVERHSSGRMVWVGRGKILALYGDNSSELKVMQDMGLDISGIRPTLLWGEVVTAEEAERKREILATEVEAQTLQTEAAYNLLSKVSEQDVFGTDLAAYVKEEFQRLGKVKVNGWAYEALFNAPPTREGFAPRGELLLFAHDAWRDVMEGRAVASVTFKDSKTGEVIIKEGLIPNNFAYARNKGLLDLSKHWVVDRLRKTYPLKIEKPTRAMKAAYESELEAAAKEALVFVDHFDEDAHAAVQVVRRGGTVEEVKMDVSYVDSSKIHKPRSRLMKEFFGYTEYDQDQKKRNPYPRGGTGSGFAAKFLPDLTSHVLEVTTVEVLATNRKGETEKKKVTLDQLSGGVRSNDGRRNVIVRDGKKYSEVRIAKDSGTVTDSDYWTFAMKGLGDEGIWDDVMFVVEDKYGEQKALGKSSISSFDARTVGGPSTTPEVFQILEGTYSFPYEIPKGLLEYYALKALWDQYTRTDHDHQYEEYTQPGYLRELNKPMGLGTKLLATQAMLSKDTVEDLEAFERIGLLATCAAANIGPGDSRVPTGDNPEKHENVAGYGDLYDNIVNPLLKSAFVAEFVQTQIKGSERKWKRDKDEVLFKEILKKRDQAPLSPLDYNYFSESQKEELLPIFS